MIRLNTPRFRLLQICIGLLLFSLLIRMGYLQIVKYDFFIKKSTIQLKKLINLYSHRGNIYDRNRTPLALTQTNYATFVVPPDLENKWEAAHTISKTLHLDEKQTRNLLYNSKSSFMWIKRQTSPAEFNVLSKLDIKGIGFIKQEKRVYPNDSLASHVLGFVGIDNQGLGGIEYKYDSLMKGTAGKLIIESDPKGRQLLSGLREYTAPNDGHHIVTTLDEYIQYISQKYLKEGIQNNVAKKGHVIVMDPTTGHVLAMAAYPEYDSNEWQNNSYEVLKNGCVADAYEPGSVFKLITISAALEEHVVTPGMTLQVPETIKVYDRTVSEAHHRKEGDVDSKTASEIIEQSLNVGTSLISERLGEAIFYKYIREFGFGSKTGIQLPGESHGLLKPPKKWSGVDYAMHSFGQGLAVTSIQMASAVSAIVNDGLYIKPKIVDYTANSSFTTRKSSSPTSKKRVISTQTAHQVKTIMEKVVTQGTAGTAAIPGYRIGGKTGTAQKARANRRGYDPNNYIASFIGFFPFDEPKYVILVMVDSPEKSIWGSSVAAPIFKNIAKDLIQYYGIEPEIDILSK